MKDQWIWLDGKFVKHKDAKIHILSHALHYGSGVFEGIRFYKTDRGTAIFRLHDHYMRMKRSAGMLRLNYHHSVHELESVTVQLLKKNKLESGYIRPIAFFGLGNLRVRPTDCVTHMAIAAWPWGVYLSHDPITVKVSRYMRIHPKSSEVHAKICGHYVNSIFAVYDAQDAGCDEALLLDYEGNVAEGPGENFFMIKDKTVITPPLGNVLEGITRESILKIARDLGFRVKEKEISLNEAKNADECFFTGTAAEVTPIGRIDNKRMKYPLGPVTQELKSTFMDIVHGGNKKYRKWLTFI